MKRAAQWLAALLTPVAIAAWIFLLTLAFLSYVLPGADGATLRAGSDTTLPYQQWLNEARAPSPDTRIWVYRDTCPGSPGYNCTNKRTIWIDPLEHNTEAVFFHELGHVYDSTELRRQDREQYRQIMGLAGRWRLPTVPSSGLQETFANSYSRCARALDDPACAWLQAR